MRPMARPLPLSPNTMLSRFLFTQAACLGVAVLIAGSRGGIHFLRAWGYSAIIGTLCWLFIDLSRHLVARWRQRRQQQSASLELRSGWPGWGRVSPITVFCGVLHPT